MNIVIITGASSGIGMEFALQMDSHFRKIDEFWLVARREDKLRELAKTLNHRTRIFAMDITDEKQTDRLECQIQKQHASVRMLINCAGFGIMGDFTGQKRACELGMIRLNCEALTAITHRILPYMKEKSRIIQMASAAAFLPQTNFAVYAATKSYVLSFSKALGEELRPRKIFVTSVCPGPVDTPFFDIAEKTGSTLAVKKYTMISADKVVKKALYDSYHKRVVSVSSLPIQGFAIAAKLLPHSILLGGMRLLKKFEGWKVMKQ